MKNYDYLNDDNGISLMTAIVWLLVWMIGIPITFAFFYALYQGWT